MPADMVIRCGLNNWGASVSRYGELRVAAYDYSTSYFKNIGIANTAYSFVPPIQDEFFVITAIILQANKNVNANTGQIVDVYEATSATSTTVDKSLIEVELIKNDRIVLTGLNIRTSEGKFLNGKTEDDDILATVAGYYVKNGGIT